MATNPQTLGPTPPLVDADWLEADPHTALRELRSAYPLVRISEDQYLALRANDVIELLSHPDTMQIEGDSYAALMRIPEGATTRFVRDFFLFANDGRHKARRQLFARSFSLGRMRAKLPEIRTVADAIVASLPRGRPFDLVDCMAARIPAEMTARVLGLPSTDSARFASMVYPLTRAFSPIYPIAEHEEIDKAAQNLFDYVQCQLVQRLATPSDDLLTELILHWQEHRPIPLPDLVHQIMGMIGGGVDTTRTAFAALVSLLLQHPDQWQALLADPGLAPSAVAEGLRFEPSVGSIVRVTTAPMDIGSMHVPAGSPIRVSTMSAMRDEQLYDRPDEFDITRTDHPRLHTVFGHGPHRCIGEMLARFEMEESLLALCRAMPELRLVDRPRMIGFGGIRNTTPVIVESGW